MRRARMISAHTILRYFNVAGADRRAAPADRSRARRISSSARRRWRSAACRISIFSAPTIRPPTACDPRLYPCERSGAAIHRRRSSICAKAVRRRFSTAVMAMVAACSTSWARWSASSAGSFPRSCSRAAPAIRRRSLPMSTSSGSALPAVPRFSLDDIGALGPGLGKADSGLSRKSRAWARRQQRNGQSGPEQAFSL